MNPFHANVFFLYLLKTSPKPLIFQYFLGGGVKHCLKTWTIFSIRAFGENFERNHKITTSCNTFGFGRYQVSAFHWKVFVKYFVGEHCQQFKNYLKIKIISYFNFFLFNKITSDFIFYLIFIKSSYLQTTYLLTIQHPWTNKAYWVNPLMTIFSSKPPPSSAHNWENWIILAERIFHEKLNTEHLKSELTYIIVQIIYHDGRFFQTQLHATYNFHKQSMSCRNLIFILSVFWKNMWYFLITKNQVMPVAEWVRRLPVVCSVVRQPQSLTYLKKS